MTPSTQPARATAAAKAAAAAPAVATPAGPPARPRRWPLAVALAAIVALAALLAQALQRNPQELPSALIGRPWPALALPTLRGAAAFGPAQLQGAPRIVNVWASWCASCREEHPVLLALAAQLRREGRAHQLLGLNYKDDPGAARAWLADGGGDPYADSLADTRGRLGLELGVYGVPETFVTDASGRIVFKHVGVLTPEVVRTRLLPLLGAAQAGG